MRHKLTWADDGVFIIHHANEEFSGTRSRWIGKSLGHLFQRTSHLQGEDTSMFLETSMNLLRRPLALFGIGPARIEEMMRIDRSG